MEEKSLKLNQETMDVLVANVIPTTKYFESQFKHMQYQINEIKDNQKDFENRMDKRFEQVDKRFEQVHQRFEQVDSDIKNLTNEVRKISDNVLNLSKTMEITIRDHIINRDRHYDNKFNNLRMFNLAMVIGVSGIALKLANII